MTVQERPLSGRLRDMRKAAGLTQKALAGAIGTSYPLVNRVENEYDWLPSPATVRSWAAATGHPEETDGLLAMLAEEKASAARQAVTRRGRQGWCSQHRQPRSQCRPEQTHVYPMRQRGDLMAEVERQAGGDVNAFVTRALMAATGWDPPDGRAAPVTRPAARAEPSRAAPGTVVFQEPGEEPVVASPVPEVPARSRKGGRR